MKANSSNRSVKEGSGGLSLLHIITAAGSVFFLFYCTWAFTASQQAFVSIDNGGKIAPPKSSASDLELNISALDPTDAFANTILKAKRIIEQKQNERNSLPKPYEKMHVDALADGTPLNKYDTKLRSDSSDSEIHHRPESSDARTSKNDVDTESVNGKKNLILGMAQDTDPKNLIVFCATLREVSQADVVIFVNEPIPALHFEIAEKYRINLEPFDLKSLNPTWQTFHPSTLRWDMMFRYISNAEKRAQYARMWMIDVRDSFFQADPFDMLPIGQRGFLAFKGVEDKRIRACGWNGKWVQDCFSENTYENVADNAIICSGVSMGDTDSVFEYLRLMSGIISGVSSESRSLGAKFPACERNGVDQGVHNVLVHKRLVPNLVIKDHKAGLVANLQAKLSVVKGMRVTSKDGHEVAVAHQYDRYPELQRLLFKKYVYWIDTDNPLAEWQAEPTCKQFTYRDNYDMFKGVCDFKMQGGVNSASTCCKHCLALAECKAFTFYAAKCFLKNCNTPSSSAGSLSGAVSGVRQSR